MDDRPLTIVHRPSSIVAPIVCFEDATVKLILGILLIAVGGLYPLVAVYRVNKRLGRDETLAGMRFVWWLIFTLVLPFALALTGVGLVIPVLGGARAFQVVVAGLWVLALVARLGYHLWRRV